MLLNIAMSMPTLFLTVDPVGADAHISSAYTEAADRHNVMVNGNLFPDAGFDIACPTSKNISPPDPSDKPYFIDFKIRCAMFSGPDGLRTPLSFYVYPRSSLSKTPFRLANNTGIIDSGYRGDIGGFFDVRITEEYNLAVGTRLLQICAPTLEAFKVIVLDYQDFNERFSNTERGARGFGSTG